MRRFLKWFLLIVVLLIAARFALRYLDATGSDAQPTPSERARTDSTAGFKPPETWHAPAGVQAQQRGIQTVMGGCTPPTSISLGDVPNQSPLPKGMLGFEFNDYQLKALYGFSVDATVMSRMDYTDDREAELAPVDLALAWGRLRDDKLIERINVTQGNRWYRWRWEGSPPLPSQEITLSSANMHMIPSNYNILKALQTIKAGDDVRIDGWLVEARGKDGWRWRSSTNRGDTGQGGCEVVYVCAVTPVPRNPQ